MDPIEVDSTLFFLLKDVYLEPSTERTHTCWFNPQMPTRTQAKTRSHELNSNLPYKQQGPSYSTYYYLEQPRVCASRKLQSLNGRVSLWNLRFVGSYLGWQRRAWMSKSNNLSFRHWKKKAFRFSYHIIQII